jgi:glycosyltransferase involved in cell wall biosynthesis
MLYLKTKNVNLIKDMGMIPYKLYKNYGYESIVATYDQDDFSYLNDEVKGLKIDFVENKYNNFLLDGIVYLRKKAKEIDVLQVFHVTLYSVLYAFAYKFLNPKGKLYIKLDCSYKLIERIEGLNPLMFKMLNLYLNKADLISVEQKSLYYKLKEILPKQKDKLINIPNGVDYDYLNRINVKYDFNLKENIILNVARVGAPEKNTEMLLKAFKRINGIESSGWKLVLVGPIEKDFNEYIKKYFNDNPVLKDKIVFKGPITDRKQIYEEYRRAKIFCLSSDFESFGIALIEAAALGDIIVSTDVGIARELIDAGNGAVVPVKDIDALADSLSKFMKDEALNRYSQETYEICKERFDWNDIVLKLNSHISLLLNK